MLVSGIMIALTIGNCWSELLTSLPVMGEMISTFPSFAQLQQRPSS
jgi:hypothetical protein